MSNDITFAVTISFLLALANTQLPICSSWKSLCQLPLLNRYSCMLFILLKDTNSCYFGLGNNYTPSITPEIHPAFSFITHGFTIYFRSLMLLSLNKYLLDCLLPPPWSFSLSSKFMMIEYQPTFYNGHITWQTTTFI